MEGIEGAPDLLPPGMNNGLDLADMVKRYAGALSSNEGENHNHVLDALRAFPAGTVASELATSMNANPEDVQASLTWLENQGAIYMTTEDQYVIVDQDLQRLQQAEQDAQ
jgi:hypothetical protein